MKIAIQPLETRQGITDSYELYALVDNPSAKTVVANIGTVFGDESLVLWADDVYDAIGQWTQDQAQARILEAFLARYEAVVVAAALVAASPVEVVPDTVPAEAPAPAVAPAS